MRVAWGPPTNTGGEARETGGRKGRSETSAPSQQNFLLRIISNPFERFFPFWRNAQFPCASPAPPILQHCAEAPGAACVAAPSAGRFLNCGVRSGLRPASFQKCPDAKGEKEPFNNLQYNNSEQKPTLDLQAFAAVLPVMRKITL